MQPDEPVLYDRTHHFPWPLTVVLVGALGAAPAVAALTPGAVKPGDSWALLVGPAIALVALGLFWRLRVIVTRHELRLIWGFFGVLQSRFVLDQVDCFRVVTFRPVRDFGGWGWRLGRNGSRCYNTSGNRGVELRIGGKSYIVGVEDPQILAQALESATGRRQAPAGTFSA
jgi:hypothetical protein